MAWHVVGLTDAWYECCALRFTGACAHGWLDRSDRGTHLHMPQRRQRGGPHEQRPCVYTGGSVSNNSKEEKGKKERRATRIVIDPPTHTHTNVKIGGNGTSKIDMTQPPTQPPIHPNVPSMAVQ